MRILAFVQPGYLLQNGHEPLHGLGVIVGEEQALAAVQCFDFRHSVMDFALLWDVPAKLGTVPSDTEMAFRMPS